MSKESRHARGSPRCAYMQGGEASKWEVWVAVLQAPSLLWALQRPMADTACRQLRQTAEAQDEVTAMRAVVPSNVGKSGKAQPDLLACSPASPWQRFGWKFERLVGCLTARKGPQVREDCRLGIGEWWASALLRSAGLWRSCRKNGGSLCVHRSTFTFRASFRRPPGVLLAYEWLDLRTSE